MHLIQNTAVDALGHLIESYINLRAGDYSRMIVDHGLSVWSGVKDVLLGARPLDGDAAMDLMSASCLGGIAIAHTGTTIPHGLSYGITYALGVPHGKAIGYFLAGYLKEASEEDRGHILDLTGFSSAAELQAFYDEVCGPERLDENTLETAVEMICARPEKLRSVPFDTDKNVLRRIAGIMNK
jgi:alcohol dehydrogenase